MLVVFLKEDKLIVPPKQKVGGGQTFLLLLLLLCLVPFLPYLEEELPVNIISSSKEADFLHIYFPYDHTLNQ